MITKSVISLALGLLFSLLLVEAVTITTLDTASGTAATDFSGEQLLRLQVRDCVGITVLEVRNPASALIYITMGERDWSTLYNTASDPGDGRYNLLASCDDGTAREQFFCVDAPGCSATPTAEGGTTPGAAPSPPPLASGAGSGSTCTPRWNCPPQWSYCNATLQQSRTCTDLNRCNQQRLTRLNVSSCAPCDEVWGCMEWGSCSDGIQVRTCTDEHRCGTEQELPVLQQACPVEIGSSSPPVSSPTKFSPTRVPLGQLKEEGKEEGGRTGIVVAGAAALLVLGAAATVWLLRWKRQKSQIVEKGKK